jgi:hypothetical protein
MLGRSGTTAGRHWRWRRRNGRPWLGRTELYDGGIARGSARDTSLGQAGATHRQDGASQLRAAKTSSKLGALPP